MELNKLWRSLFLVLLLPFALSAQDFGWQARLHAVKSPGFYEIRLDPNLTAKLKSDLSDLRIRDSAGSNVAYLVRSSAEYGRPLIQLPILNVATDSLGSTVEVGAKALQGTDHLCLIIGNTAVARPASISGSNDRKRWFIIAEDMLLSPSAEGRSDRLLLSLAFPFNRYAFLKVVIRNGGSDPLDILEAAVYNTSVAPSNIVYVANAASAFAQQERGGQTIVTVSSPEAFITDRLTLGVTGPRFYKRPARLLITTEHARQADVVRNFELVSGSALRVNLPSVKVRSMTIEIENGDDPPLKVTSIRTEQEQRSIITYLQPGTHFLLAGNRNAAAPKFDLAGFTDSIPATVPLLGYEAPAPREKEARGAADSKWLWIAIVVMIAVLGYFTFRLTSDVHKAGVGRVE